MYDLKECSKKYYRENRERLLSGQKKWQKKNSEFYKFMGELKMNKQEMAEWLAENVLRWTYCSDCETWVADLGEHWRREPSIVDIIYSPDGFFAVWDAVIKAGNNDVTIGQEFVGGESEQPLRCLIDDGVGEGKDRYEAFYNAVYEAMKE